RGLALSLDARTQVLAARGRDDRGAVHVVDQLGVDLARAAEHRQPRTSHGTRDAPANAMTTNATTLVFVVEPDHDAAPAALPALRRMSSPSYLTPLPL